MNNIAILGGAFGDEGKGRIVHDFSPKYDWVVRFNGGANAGHTIYRDNKKYVHNLLPSVDFRVPKVKAYLGAGMVIDLEKLSDEIITAEKDFPGVAHGIYVDKNAFIVESKHKSDDKIQNVHIGSTNRGIGPAYADKVARKGTRISDLLFNQENEYTHLFNKMKSLGVNFVSLLEVKQEMLKSKILFESAQGVLLDINHGIYPYVSSSDCTLGGIYASGFAFAPPDDVYGVVKCYATKVGEGPFPTEIFGSAADTLRERGNEYGATTGRPRRIGWLDLPALQYACAVSGINKLIITKMDILSGMDKIPICTKYEKPVIDSKDFFTAQPIYSEMDGWKSVNKTATTIYRGDYDDFNPDFEYEIHNFLSVVQQATQCKITHISCGITPQDIHYIPYLKVKSDYVME